MPLDPHRTIAFFAHDSTESTVIKRATAFQAYGWEVIGFMFKRVRPAKPRPLTWDNVELGITVDLHYMKRATKLLAAFVKIITHREQLRRCTVFYARNIDMLLLAVFGKYAVRPGVTVVYEVLDIPRAGLGGGLLNRAFRWAERRLIARSDLLVVSSPEFMTQYFFKYQSYEGPWRLLENKVSPSQLPPEGIDRKGGPPAGPPWIIGWFGTLRCTRSVELLNHIARRLGDRIQIHIRGQASEEYLPTSVIEAAADRHPNIVYYGPYDSPRNLPTIYGEVHFTWCIDYLDAGTNSDWLLPNRIYEGGLMGSVALARKQTATGRMIEREGLGFALDEPLDSAVMTLLDALSFETYMRMRHTIQSKRSSLFVDETETHDLLQSIERMLLARHPASLPSKALPR